MRRSITSGKIARATRIFGFVIAVYFNQIKVMVIKRGTKIVQDHAR